MSETVSKESPESRKSRTAGETLWRLRAWRARETPVRDGVARFGGFSASFAFKLDSLLVAAPRSIILTKSKASTIFELPSSRKFSLSKENVSGINFLMQVQFLEFSSLFLMQVQVGVLPELIFKQVVMQVPLLSIPGFWGTLLGLRNCREDSVGIFALENQSH